MSELPNGDNRCPFCQGKGYVRGMDNIQVGCIPCSSSGKRSILMENLLCGSLSFFNPICGYHVWEDFDTYDHCFNCDSLRFHPGIL